MSPKNILKMLQAAEEAANASKAASAAPKLTAADRAAVGKLAEEYTAKQPVTRLSEALGNVGAEGKKLRVTQTDRTGAKYLGGAPFSMMQKVDPRYAEAKATWGVKTPGAAKNIANQSEADVVWSTLIGSPTQHRSNELIFDKLYKAFQKSAKQGNLSPELRTKFNAALEPIFGEGADILDPKLRKEIDTFEKRAVVGNLLLGEGLGGALRGGSIIPGPKIMAETTEPMLRDVETFSIGPRLFTLDQGVVTRPDLHPAFPEILTGQDLDQLFVPVPNRIALPTFNEDFMARTGRKKPGYYDLTMTPPGEPYPTQVVDEKYLNFLQKEGYAKGGLAHMDTGGTPPKPRTRAGTPVTEGNMITGALRGLGETILGAGHGSLSALFGAPADLLNMVDIPKIMTGESYQIPYGSEYFKENLPGAPTTQTGKTAQELGTFVPTPVTGVTKTVQKGAKALAPTAADIMETQLLRATEPMRMNIVPEGGPTGKLKAPANPIGFYNPAEKAALNLQRKKGTGSAMVSDLKKTPGVNDGRLAELGLGDLASRPEVTREELLAATQENRIPLRESVNRPIKETEEISEAEDVLKRENQYMEHSIRSIEKHIADLESRSPNHPELAERREKINTLQSSIDRNNQKLANLRPAKFGPDTHPDYSLPGGENYREIRVNLPESKAELPSMEGFTVETIRENKYTGQRDVLIRNPQGNIVTNRYGFRGDDAQVLRDEAASRARNASKEDNFYHQTHHGDEPNVLFHLRVADHVDVDGKKGLLIDELQSDWHQKGREKGYGPKYEDRYRAYYDTPTGQVDIGFGKTQEEVDRMVKASGWEGMPVEIKTEKTTAKVGQGVPDAPFKENWYQLGLKRAIKEAADTGMDRVYLTTGQRQADRYDLSKQISKIEYDEFGNLRAYNQDGAQVISEPVAKDKLSDYVGKDMAKKIIENSEKRNAARLKYRELLKSDASNDVVDVAYKEYLSHPTEYSGLDLKVGGEGMKQYYDKTYKNFLDKYAKQFGARVGETTLPAAGRRMIDLSSKEIDEVTSTPGFIQEMMKLSGGKTAFQMSDDEYRRIFDTVLHRMRPEFGEKVYYIDITPKMRESAKIGQSYKDGGAVHMAEGGAVDYEAAFNKMLQDHVNMAQGGAVDYESSFNEMLQRHVQGMAEGGEVNSYNSNPDMSDGGRFIPAPAFADGGAVKSIWTAN